MVAIFPNSAIDASLSLEKEHLTVPAIAGVSTASIKVSGTPTLILLDRDRHVQETWIGKLDEAGRKSVYSALGLPMTPLAADQGAAPRTGGCKPRHGESGPDLCMDQWALSMTAKITSTNDRP
jgi:hypothetical protein